MSQNEALAVAEPSADGTPPASDRLDRALDRLTGALERLQRDRAAAEGRARAAEERAAGLERELADLRGDRHRSASETEALRRENARLAELTETVSERLERAIGELEASLQD